MNPLIELITAWDAYTSETSSPISVKAFSEFYLAETTLEREEKPLYANPQELARVTGRLSSIYKTYLKIAIKDLPDTEIEWYFLLHTIHQTGKVRKTEVASINLLLEPTTCIDILNRMLKFGVLDEEVDPTDKRARLLSISNKGATLLKQLQQLVDDINHKLYGHIAKADQELILRTLTPIEKEHTERLISTVKKKQV